MFEDFKVSRDGISGQGVRDGRHRREDRRLDRRRQRRPELVQLVEVLHVCCEIDTLRVMLPYLSLIQNESPN